jgi:S1-C subfamily serine protease
MDSALVNISNELAGIVEKLQPYIVSVNARRRYPSSGLLWSTGVVVTADHTVERDEEICVTLSDTKAIAAKLVGRDPGTDLAVLRLLDPNRPLAELKRAQAVKSGELAIVLGRSPKSGPNASLGIVSAVSGPWRTWRGGQLDAYIRIDAKLFPNCSGGAVVNARGELIGVASSALSRIAGLAVPVSTLATVAAKLLEKGFVPRGYLGIGVQAVALPDPVSTRLGISLKAGLLVLTVEPDGPTDKAGLLIGDLIVAVGDTPVGSTEDLQVFSDSAVIGKNVKVKLIRGGEPKEFIVTVGERPGGRS